MGVKSFKICQMEFMRRSEPRLTIRFFKKWLRFFPACLALLLVLSVWQMLNDINVKVNLLATTSVSDSVDEQSRQLTLTRANTTKQNRTPSLLLPKYATRESLVQHHLHRTKLLTTAFCPPNSVFLLIIVSTNVGNFDRRQLIRKTWGADFSINTRWKTVFLLGKNNNDKEMEGVSKEAQIYGDIVQADYQEHFWNMSYKVAMGFEWSVKYCTFNYLLKADDDVFVNTLGLMDFLSKYATPKRQFYTGHGMTKSPVLRSGKYGVSRQEYNETIYKPYCSGGGYVLSRDVVEVFLSHFDVSTPLKIDDAYIGLLAERAGIKVTDNKEFRMSEKNCEYKETTLVQHPARGDCLVKLYNKMVEGIWGRLG